MSQTDPGDADKQAKDHLLGQVRAWLRGQGYALEYETARQLRQAGFSVRQGRTYRDLVTQKTRDIDVLAELRHPGLRPPTDSVLFVVVVECKKSSAPWIVRKAPFDEEQRLWRPIGTEPLVDYLAKHQTLARLTPNTLTAYEVDQKPGAKGDQNGAHDAMSQVVSGARGLLAFMDRSAVYFHLVVALDGPLVSLCYTDDGDEDLQMSDHERIVWSGAPDLPQPIVIDVVTRGALTTYAKRLLIELQGVQRSVPDRSFVGPKAASF